MYTVHCAQVDRQVVSNSFCVATVNQRGKSTATHTFNGSIPVGDFTIGFTIEGEKLLLFLVFVDVVTATTGQTVVVVTIVLGLM